MSEFLGARISLISRSDIRYVGILHEINSDEATVSLENVKSFGTEGRKAKEGKPEEETVPSEQIYEYIVFRGTDVKDLRIEQAPAAVKENAPPAVPNDPAIVGARARPANAPPGPPNQHGLPGGPGGPGFGYYPPPWGMRPGAGGPPPPQAFGGMQYPPPPAGWFPPGQGFPPGPPGPPGAGPWGNYPAYPSGPGGPLGSAPPNNRQAQPQQSIPAVIGPAGDKKTSTPTPQTNATPEPKPSTQPIQQQVQAPATRGPPPPVQSKPTVEEVKATAASLSGNQVPTQASEPSKAIPTGPKGSTRPSQIMPAVPLPTALTSKATQPTQNVPSKAAQEASASALRDATLAAKAAVAVAMAKMNAPGSSQQANGSGMENLTKKVNEMRVNAPRGDAPRGGAHTRGGRGRGPRPAKVEVPDADFDFASANAKFNKEEIVKEAIASGSPLGETVPNGGAITPETGLDSAPGSGALPAYNKTKSFFDNISSEAKDRAENNGQKPGGREWRGEEQRKNMETFGQGSVDGGYRGGYRGRGRGRGGRGRGFGRGAGVRGGGPYRSNRETQSAS